MCVRQWLIANKEIISMALEMLLVFTGMALLWSLYLQKRSICASIFNDISSRTSDLIREIPWKDANPHEIQNWYVRLFNEFERFIYLRNHRYVGKGFEEYYRDLIVRYIERLTEEFPNIAKEIDNMGKGDAYKTLKEYYRKHTKKRPFVN
jgi:hypothetical protein